MPRGSTRSWWAARSRPCTVFLDSPTTFCFTLSCSKPEVLHVPWREAARCKSNLSSQQFPLRLKTSRLPSFLGKCTFRKTALLPQRQPENPSWEHDQMLGSL